MQITFSNQKGGVGKSTTAINVAAVLAAMGHQVLLLDLDPQRNASQGMGVKEQPDKNLFTLLRDKHPIQEAILHRHGVDLVPAARELKTADSTFVNTARKEDMVRRAVKPVKDQYDFIIYDTQPHMGLLTLNALVASDHYVIPLQAEYFALEGLTEMLNTVAKIKEDCEADVQFTGVFLTRYNSRKKLCRTVAETVEEQLGDKMFKTFIHENILVSEAQANGMPIFQYIAQRDLASQAAEDYLNLTNELLEKLQANGQAK